MTRRLGIRGYVRLTATSLLDDAGVTHDEHTREYACGLSPMDRFDDSREITEAVVWPCSVEASSVTGTALPVDGGSLTT